MRGRDRVRDRVRSGVSGRARDRVRSGVRVRSRSHWVTSHVIVTPT